MEPEYQSQQQEESQAAAESLHFQAEEDTAVSLPPPPLQFHASTVIQRDCGENMSCAEEGPLMSEAPPVKQSPRRNNTGVLKEGLGSLVSWGSDAVKSGGRMISKGLGDAGNAISSGINTAGDLAQSGASAIGSIAESNARNVGNLVATGGDILGSGINTGGEQLGSLIREYGSDDLGDWVDKGAEGLGKGISRTGRSLNRTARSTGRKVKKVANQVGSSDKKKTDLAQSAVKRIAKFGGNFVETGGEALAETAEKGFEATIGNGLEVLSSLEAGIEGALEHDAKGELGDALTAAGLSLADAFLDDKVGALDAIAGPEGEEMNSEELAPEVKVDEMMAHDMAYWIDMSEEKAEQLTKMGYDPTSVQPVFGTRDFSMVYIMPKPGSGQLPVVSFTGTNSGEDHTKANLNPTQVGHKQFYENKQIIDSIFQQLGDKVIVVGHSLGGALAKIATSEYTSQIARMTTFQAPGIAESTKDQFDRHKAAIKAQGKEPPEINMHLNHNDIVSHAGVTDFEGPQYLHDKGDIDSYSAHSSMLMDEDTHKVTKFESYPFPFRRKTAETVRSAIGGKLDH